MLLNMHIKNIALIDDLDICFEDGLNILTGETGAGKSIILGSLGIGLGGKFTKEILRDENKEGLVELIFTVDTKEVSDNLKNIDIYPSEEGEILISRCCNGQRVINRVNEHTVTAAKLKEISAIFIDLHAQHEQQSLLKPIKHLEILDKFGGEEIFFAKDKVKECYREYISIRNNIEEISINEDEKLKQLDFLNYQLKEIELANLVDGEDELLEIQYSKMNNSKEIVEYGNEIYQMTGYGTKSVSDSISASIPLIKKIMELDTDLESLYSILIDVDSLINDFNNELSSYMESMEFNQEEFVSIETRMDLINNLKAKYGKNIDDINIFYKNAKTKYDELKENDIIIEELNKRLIKSQNILINSNNELTKVRKKKASELCQLIKTSLIDLNFLAVEFDMIFEDIDRFSEKGTDNAYFVISTNVGEKMRPLYEVASGGELSRVMLAIKSCLAAEDEIPTLIFDEIDVGISGKTAQKVAELLSHISKNHQIISITHLPQIASMADVHYMIEKNVENNKTFTNIRKLNNQEEVNEIARLFGGETITKNLLESAKEMKELADRTKLY